MNVGQEVKVQIPSEKQCFPPDGILTATIMEIIDEGIAQECYLIRWQCSPSVHGNTVIGPNDILD